MSVTRMAMIAVLGLASAQAIAAGREHSKKDHQMLTEAAQALQATKPDLAERLHKYAVHEAGESEGTESDRPQDIQLLRDAAASLEKSKPGLARKLRKFADKEEKEMSGGKRRGAEPGTRKPSETPTGY